MLNLEQAVLRQSFFPGFLALFVNPFYFARRGLYLNIKDMAQHISGKVLDVGCGQKPYRSLFRVKEYIGIDIEQSGHSHKNEPIDVFYDGKRFPFEKESFDAVISNEVLEHVFNPEEHLTEICRVLKPEGMLLLTVPFAWDEHEQPYDFGRYTSFGLSHLLKKNGFEVIEMRKSMADVRAIFQLINAAIYKWTATKNRYLHAILAAFLTAPFNILGLLLYKILPGNADFYLDNIVLARKGKNDKSF